MELSKELTPLRRKIEEAKEELISLLGSLASEGDWDSVEKVKTWARSLDLLTRQMTDWQGPEPISLPTPDPRALALGIAGGLRPAAHQPLPYFYIDRDDKLVMRGRSRDGGYYEHRVVKPHYDIVVGKVAGLARSGDAFYSQDLQDRGEMPVHEPLLIMRLFAAKGLVSKLGKGRFCIIKDATKFEGDAGRLWTELPRG